MDKTEYLTGMGSSVTVQCEFGPEVRSHLLNLRRGDWITIEGQLSFDGSQPTIQNARIVGGALPAENE